MEREGLMPEVVSIGKFVKVGDSIGIIVGLPGIDNTPEDHYAVWFGEKSKTALGAPLVKTVPVEYCNFINIFEVYH